MRFVEFLKSKWVWITAFALWLRGYGTITNEQARRYVRAVTFAVCLSLIIMGYVVFMLGLGYD